MSLQILPASWFTIQEILRFMAAYKAEIKANDNVLAFIHQLPLLRRQ